MIASILLVLSAAATLDQGGAAEAFKRLQSLEGNWQGTFTWTDGRTGPMAASYRISGRGSVVFEDLIQENKPVMTTAYHLDKDELRMTHYCGAGNQPRLKTRSIDLAKNLLDFEFVDITNLAAPDAPHVHGFTMRMVDTTHLEIDFAFRAKGKESVEHIALARVG